MIDWISDWLKQIIIVIMLAAFVDLMMPNNGLQRYVRTVLGLFVLLTLLTPIFSLFQKSLDTYKLSASIEQLPALMNAKTNEAVGVARMKSLESVFEEGNQLKAVNDQQAIELLEARLSAELRNSVETIHQVHVKDISVQIQADNNGKPIINSIQAILHNIDGSTQKKIEQAQVDTHSKMNPITPIKPVQIQVRVGDSIAGASTDPDPSRLNEMEQQAKSQVYELLTQQWQLKRDQVQLYYESEQRKVR